MSVPGMIERLVLAARQKGGERLELRSGKPAVLVSGDTHLQAGNAVIDGQGLAQWLEGVLGPERWVLFELGEEVTAVAELAGEPRALRASRSDGFLQVALDLAVAELRPQPSEPAPEPVLVPEAPRQPSAPVSLDRPLDRMLRRLVQLGGSDLHLSASMPPMIRLHGDMAALKDFPAPLSSEHILLMCEEIAPGPNRNEFRKDNDTDLAYEIPGTARFRVNMFRDRRGVGAVFRQIPHKILTFEDLGLPDCARNLCMLHKGLVLVTGPTGSGKSTTLATMVDYVNEKRSDHIITIEDPIEFVHENKRCLVHQREVYHHTESFKRALRAALREDPDVVLVGELRDLETMAIAIETAETGHLVFGTLHTTSAVSTVDRLIDQFPPDRQDQIRVMLAESLKGVIAQILLKRVGGGRIAAYEILLGVPAISNLVREGKTFQIPTIMQTGKRLGMRTMTDSLAELVRSGQVEAQEALSKAVDKDGLRALLKIEQ
jgi:twitching motility protein PilT